MDRCNVCGGKEMNLVDGFYYCVECGTQDVNVRETVVEQTVMGDGTFALTTSKKITAVAQEGIEMSSEWHKWHIFNFILVGLTDELIALGAKPTLKMKVLWIWTRYVKQYQVKDDLQSKSQFIIEEDDETEEGEDGIHEEGSNESDREDSYNDSHPRSRKRKAKKSKPDKIVQDMKTITKGTMLAILYVALNLDRSDIQLSHLFRFIREGRLSLYECMKFVPKELKLNAVRDWKSFTRSLIEYNPVSIRELSLTCFKILKLGVPLVPNLRKLVKNLVQELCLPSDIKSLVFSLMHFLAIDFLDIDAKTQKSLVRIPDYEGICMAYILVALKLCFGLDDDYEMRIAKEIDKINDEENHLKSYKLGFFAEPSDRLFSFNEWYQHLQFRKYILCKNYLPISQQFNDQTDAYIFMEHLEKRKKREVKLSDSVTMDILNKIHSDHEPQVIPKKDFPATLTPMTTYIDVIAQHVKDPDLKLLLSEDFTQYSLKYAIKDLSLPGYKHGEDNNLGGVCESGKTYNKYVTGTLTGQEGDMNMVYVRYCQNKNWLKTDPPKVHHVTKIGVNENISDKESDHGYDSNVESSNNESDATHITISNESIKKDDNMLEVIDDQDDSKCIFDDDLTNTIVAPFNNSHITIKEEREDTVFEFYTQTNLSMQDSKLNCLDTIENSEEVSWPHLCPNTIDKDEMIKELIEQACKKYKIPIPKENATRKQYKRKVNLDDETTPSEPKKKRTIDRSKPGEAKRVVDNFISAYYSSLQNDILNEVSQQVKSIIDNVRNPNNSDAENFIHSQNDLNETSVINNYNDIDNTDVPQLCEENEKSHTEVNTNDSIIENNEIHPEEQNGDSDTRAENIEDEVLHELFPKSDPKFDERDHDIRQLYVKIGDDSDAADVSISDITNDPEIDKIIQTQIDKYSNMNKGALEKNILSDIIDDVSDSDDDVPLNIIKETCSFEQEKMERKKEKLEPLLTDPSSVKEFKYWIRHYKSGCMVKSRTIGKKFDMELLENLPVSFVFVIRECSAILGCSMFSLYKNMQNIEEILIANMM